MTTIVNEIMACASMALTMYPGLTQGAIAAIIRHGTAEHTRWLPRACTA